MMSMLDIVRFVYVHVRVFYEQFISQDELWLWTESDSRHAMPLDANLDEVFTADPVVVDDRWIMSFAAGIDDQNALYWDNRNNRKLVAHPLLYWAVSWPITWNRRQLFLASSMTKEEAGKAVHFSEDVIYYAPIDSGTTIHVVGQVVQVKERTKGSSTVTRYDFYDKNHGKKLLLTQWTTSYYRGVHLAGIERSKQKLLPPAPPVCQKEKLVLKKAIEISFWDAHIYTECSRIWNPIHTDKRVAEKAGLADIILHGTAILCKGVTTIVNHFGKGNPTKVKRVCCGAFKAQVFLPSTLMLEVYSVGSSAYCFDIKVENGGFAVQDASIVFEPDPKM